MKDLPLGMALQAELERIAAHYPPAEAELAVDGHLRLRATVRGVRVLLVVDPEEHPRRPPEVSVLHRRFVHPLVSPDGRVTGLSCLSAWNRTLGLGTVLAELERAFIEEPPVVNPDPWRLVRQVVEKVVAKVLS